MPDHLHALLAFPRDKQMSNVISLWKGYLARMVGIRWQRGFFDHRIKSADSWDSTAQYIRMNPVRAELTTDSKNWPYKWEAK
jgi:REP element-mobilizing transposase RayT